jgi:hypothetical protein
LVGVTSTPTSDEESKEMVFCKLISFEEWAERKADEEEAKTVLVI